VWLAPPDYGQRLRADVICFTYHDLVFSRCQPGIACAARFNRQWRPRRTRFNWAPAPHWPWPSSLGLNRAAAVPQSNFQLWTGSYPFALFRRR